MPARRSDVAAVARSAAGLLFCAIDAACVACAAPAAWECRDEGAWRVCAVPLVIPPGWSEAACAAVAGGTLACARVGWAPGAFGWDCTTTAAGTVCLARGAAMPPEPAPDGWQGYVDPAGRLVARWRRAGNATWDCHEASCRDLYPDRPSADEWECVEGDGRVLCRGRFLRGIDPAWRCAAQGDRFLCLLLDPDYPEPAEPGVWRCFYDDSTRTGRTCGRLAVPVASAPCPGRRSDGRCWPVGRVPACWLDEDCGPGRSCRTGLCVFR